MTEYRKDIEKVVQDMGYSNPLCSHSQGYCEQCGILASPPELAFFMKDHSDPVKWLDAQPAAMGYRPGEKTSAAWYLVHSTPSQWIEAAVKAWEAKK